MMARALAAMSLGLLLSLASAAQQEPVAPAATLAVQNLLADSVRLARENKKEEALQAAEQALSVAGAAKDVAGEALAQRERALRLTELKRPTEAREAWQQAGMAWKKLGEGPGQEEALAMQALLLIAEKPEEARILLGKAVALARAEMTRPLAAARQLNELGKSLADLRKQEDALDVYSAALAIQEQIPLESLEMATSINGLARLAYAKKDLASARDYYQRALAIRERLAPGSLEVAASLQSLGSVAYNQGDLAVARDVEQRAVAIQEKLAPASLDLARGLYGLGTTCYSLGDLKAARDYHERALAIREKLAPGSGDAAMSLMNLGVVAGVQGDLATARDYFQRARAIWEIMVPGSPTVAMSLNNLGNVAASQGDFTAARDYYQASLEIKEKLVPGSLDVAFSLNNLGIVSMHQGDLTAALDYQQRALAIFEKLAPDSLELADVTGSLGEVTLLQGHLTAARDYFQKALAVQERQSSSSYHVAVSLNNLGVVAKKEGDLTAARDYYRRALAIQEKQIPGSLDMAASLSNLGIVANDLGDLTAAREYHRQSLAIREKLAPGSLDMAVSLHNLSKIAAGEGDPAAAAQLAERSWRIIRAQASGISGDEARQAFGGHYAYIGADLIRYQLALGRLEDAFVTLEEGRAQALQQMLLERDTARRQAPVEVWRAFEEAQRTFDLRAKALEKAGETEVKAADALGAASALQTGGDSVDATRQALAAAQKETERARDEYTQARVEAERRWGIVRQAVKAVLPSPVDVKRARELVPSGVVWIEFSVGESGNTMFLVRGGGQLVAYTLPVPLKELEAQVSAVRRSVSREAGEGGTAPAGSAELRVAAARRLYQELFPKEARKAIAEAKRVVLSPDGALWELPFAALVMNDSGAAQYLGFEKPLSFAQSLAVFSQVTGDRAARAGGKGTVLVVGNPLFDNSLRTERPVAETQRTGAPVMAAKTAKRGRGELALLSSDGSIPEPLPGAEEEARRVAAIYGTKALIGAEPTEKRFREQAGEAQIIHLATHGYFNPYRALSSGVRLALPEQETSPAETEDDGALQAWEILNQLHLKAELVVLSACETGSGARVKGEGLVGLTRAFQVAGARSVLASQWPVADQSTADLMVAFHKRLRAGDPKDEALRRAMLNVGRKPATADPFFWAPFLLIGDYRGR